MDFAALPPEVNSSRMYAGPGAGPMLAAATAWDGLAAELQSTAAAYSSVIAELTAGPWTGSSSAIMAAAAAPYLEWMNTAAAQSEQTAVQAKSAAAAYELAFAMTVPPPMITANRSLLATLVATNMIGQNAMAIAANEAQYAEMWAQDAAAMYGYAGSSAAASTLSPFETPPQTTNPAATASQSISTSGSQLMSAVPQALQGLATAPAAADPATTLLTLLTAIIIPLTAADLPIATASATASTTSATASFTSTGTTFRGLLINADRDFADHKGPFTGNGPGGMMLPQWIIGGDGGVGAPSDAPSLQSVAAGTGQATTVGRLSVPAAWTVAAPEMRSAAYTLPITSASAAPEIAVGTSSSWLTDMALAGAAGRAVTGNAVPRQSDRRIRFLHQDTQRSAQSRSEQVGEMATKLQAITEMAQSLLAKLSDSGLMTGDEVTEQQRRFSL